jgi:uncharacterized protein with ParB-like and HNH nuclease domain
MELDANSRTLGTLLSENRSYVVPRYQREFSWEKEHVSSLWSDILRQITFKDGKAIHSEYFCGSLVLAGKDNAPTLRIVDGQQRLTTLTVFLRALIHSLEIAGESKGASSLFKNYIEGLDIEGKPYFKLVNETPHRYFQSAIQQQKQVAYDPSSNEEKRLKAAYVELVARMSEDKLLSELKTIPYRLKLAALRDQVLFNLKFIRILVSDEDHAYTIFETLNARGIDLTPVDLVKNWVFKHLPREHPVDDAKVAWTRMTDELSNGPDAIDKNIFFRHYWLSRYGYVTEGRIYSAFRELADGKKFTAQTFQDQLLLEAKVYCGLAFPRAEEYRSSVEKQVYESLAALNSFKVSQVRPVLMALAHARSERKLPARRHAKFLKLLEDFHFAFTVISAGRSSGLERIYSRFANEMRSATSVQLLGVIGGLETELKERWPSSEVFKSGVESLWFTNDRSRDKKTIQYLFSRYERFLGKTKELALHDFSLEHIASQSYKPLESVFGHVGNLLPLSEALNNDAATNDFATKLGVYKRSSLKTVSEFRRKYGRFQKWDASAIAKRTTEIADVSSKHIWQPPK